MPAVGLGRPERPAACPSKWAAGNPSCVPTQVGGCANVLAFDSARAAGAVVPGLCKAKASAGTVKQGETAGLETKPPAARWVGHQTSQGVGPK